MKLFRVLARPASTDGAPKGDGVGLATAVSSLENLLGLAWVIEARDPYSGGHLWRVSRYAALLCERAGSPQAVCARVSIASFLHGLGKVGIPDAVLSRVAAPGADEQARFRTHPALGARLLGGHPFAHWAAEAVRSQHERPDGKGYPQALTAEAIPHSARVIGICDAFDSLTSARSHDAAMPVAQALERICDGLGHQFDALLGRHFLALGAEGLFDHIAGHSDDGIPLRHCLTCGPTLVVRREQQPGDSVYCRHCGGEYRLRAPSGNRPGGTEATGRKGSAEDLAPAVDTALIRRFVRDTADAALTPLAGQ